MAYTFIAGWKMAKVERIDEELCRRLHKNSCNWSTHKIITQMMEEDGTPVRKGPFLKAEDEIINENIEMFKEEYPDIDPIHLLLLDDPKEKRRIARRTGFYTKLSLGLNRTCYEVHHRLKRVLYADRMVDGKFTAEEEQKITHLHEVYGNNWNIIESEMGRKSSSLRAKWRNMGGTKRGKWSDEEDKLLIASIEDWKSKMSIEDDESLHSSMPWEEIAKVIPSRNAKQCRSHWQNTLRQPYFVETTNKDKFCWTKENKAELVFNMSAQNVQYEEDVDFDAIRQTFENGGFVISSVHLRRMWQRIKTSIPGNLLMSFEEKLDKAVDQYL